MRFAAQRELGLEIRASDRLAIDPGDREIAIAAASPTGQERQAQQSAASDPHGIRSEQRSRVCQD
jgi:hypothetical protein